MKELGSKVRQLRKRHDMTAGALAEMLDRKGANKAQFVYDLEKGRVKRVSLEILRELSSIFNVKIEYFFDDWSEKNDEKQSKYPLLNKENEWKTKYMKLLEKHNEVLRELADCLREMRK